MRQSGNLQPMIDFGEHGEVNGVAGKKVIILDENGDQVNPGHLYGYDASADVWRPIQIVESTTSPGDYVLAVGNIDGSMISGGGTTGTVTTNYLLLEDGTSSLLLEDGTSHLLLG